ncbi:DUF732 domain-containing protein [Mycobacterium sp.]|uniref:DUF732 domain-containing protein n=1 Tax=Mycobacterium sp. TaxID=1785 RepID=UPI002C97B46F|nr:DUF732 domain-containing protein [Mycobacterium sp.]HTQ21903.1 DUF732 domain-containing protein [Mycobacterium sp.]
MNPSGSHRTAEKVLASAALVCAALSGIAVSVGAPCARADVVAYLVNVTMRPGYHFANADAALQYGHGLCDKISQGRTYPQVMGDVKADFNTSDEYQASYLISQAVNELCPELIWQLRDSAANYRPTEGKY